MTMEDVIKLYNNKKVEVMKNGTDRDKEKIKTLQAVLNLDNWIFKVSVNEALNVLYFLGIKKDKLWDTYTELASIENYKLEENLTVFD